MRKRQRVVDLKKTVNLPIRGGSRKLNCLIVLVLVLPTLFSTATIDPTNPIRYLFLCFFILLFIIFFLVFKKDNFKQISKGPTKDVFSFGIAYGVWCLLCTLFAVNSCLALYETLRHFLNIVLLYIVISAIMHDRTKVLSLCKGVLLASLIQSGVGILQFFEIAFTQIPGTSRPYGLMVHRNLFGSAEALLLPFVMYVLYSESKKWRILSIIAIIGICVSVFISQTRAAWISAFFIMLIAVVSIAVYINDVNKWKYILSLFFTIAISVTIIFSIYNYSNGDTFFRSIKQRTANILVPLKDTSEASGTANDRLIMWRETLNLIRDNLLVGVGLGNWKLAILKFGSDNLDWSYGTQLPSHPHNVYLEVLSESGIPGALIYFAFWLMILRIPFKILKSEDQDNKIVIIIMLAGLAGFAIDCTFSFPTERIEHSLYAIFIVGIIMGIYKDENKTDINKFVLKGRLLVAFFITFVNLIMAFSKYSYEEHTNLAKAYRIANRNEEAIQEVEKGKNLLVTIDPNGEPIELQSACAYVELDKFDEALKEIKSSLNHNPNSSRIWTTMGVVYANQHKFNEAINSYDHALSLTPNYDVAIKNLSAVYFLKKDYINCLKTLNKININSDTTLHNFYYEVQKKLNMPRKKAM
jgi:putative inorganic carbon (HCO3(-)) transporter